MTQTDDHPGPDINVTVCSECLMIRDILPDYVPVEATRSGLCRDHLWTLGHDDITHTIPADKE